MTPARALWQFVMNDRQSLQRAIERWESEGGAAPGGWATPGVGPPMEPMGIEYAAFVATRLRSVGHTLT